MRISTAACSPTIFKQEKTLVEFHNSHHLGEGHAGSEHLFVTRTHINIIMLPKDIIGKMISDAALNPMLVAFSDSLNARFGKGGPEAIADVTSLLKNCVRNTPTR